MLGTLIRHSERWGKVWFGLVFWGSVLFATAREIWPDAAVAPLLLAALAIGLSAGIGAHRRGYWV